MQQEAAEEEKEKRFENEYETARREALERMKVEEERRQLESKLQAEAWAPADGGAEGEGDGGEAVPRPPGLSLAAAHCEETGIEEAAPHGDGIREVVLRRGATLGSS